MFDSIVCDILEDYATNPPEHETDWYAPWTGILFFLFPVSQGYFVTPMAYFPINNHQPPYLAFEVSRWTEPPRSGPLRRPLLIVVLMYSKDWQAGIPSLETEINRLIDAAFSGETIGGTAISKVYWIGVIGSHWRFGVKEDNGQRATPLIDWHDTTHDEASFDDFQQLAALVGKM